jgi:hypothetical protein
VKRVVVFLLAAVFAYQLMAESRPTLKISISRGGEITADGKATTLEALVPRFRDLAAKQGIIWYYSGASKEAQPPPNALKVLNAILEQKLLVRDSSKPDFSDVVLVAGRSDGTMVSPQSVILPAEFRLRLVQSCWGKPAYAADITDYWMPRPDETKQMEQLLPAHLQQTPVRGPFSEYYRQYVGIIASGKRLVFVSALGEEWLDGDWTCKPIIACGGSTDFWRVAFDPQTKQFSHWDVNGPL